MDSGGPSSGATPAADEDVDLYELLGVDKSASQDAIKKAYRKAALQHHPDKVPEERRAESEVKFKAVTQAYEILRDEQKRELYDAHGMAAFDPSRGPGGMGGEGGKCKGKCTVATTKALEVYIPRGSMHGERIVLEGEGDQLPDQTPGDIILVLVEKPNDTFTRIGADLSADLTVTVAEALAGFSRVVLKHLDGRGIHIDHPRGKVLRPSEVIKVPGEGMPPKRGETKGDLYLIVKIEFPTDGWLDSDEKSYDVLKGLLPPPADPIVAEEVDEVEYEKDADIEEMGASSGDPRYGQEWEDVDEDEGGPQCAQQ
ncbi:chaperone dnaJ 3 [Magnaporthiopsis poae ATCC 64411]|uniref:Chaperone dnaJ 3 n=1 Tax=Magnaporthiopsis poae (strain ATCC 64411 / 73-15) TaxID=644358 RepID=A0A0C4E6D6_MAGP6|nr:chaperone dnaJ 3 [Magnaporthiopsis poae ATCC 64411]